MTISGLILATLSNGRVEDTVWVLILIAMLVFAPVVISAWHWLTLRRYARALAAIDEKTRATRKTDTPPGADIMAEAA